MNDAKLSDLLTSLEREEVTVVQVEKNCHKWITHLLNRISGRFSDDFEVVQTVKLILENVVKNNQLQVLAPHVLPWINDILSRVTQAANCNTYLSILALFLRYNKKICKSPFG